MPNHDGTGPLGNGRPGKGLGPCGQTDKEHNTIIVRGFSKGMRHGFGRRGWMHNVEMMDSNTAYSYDKESLLKEKSRLEKLLNWVNDRLVDIEE